MKHVESFGKCKVIRMKLSCMGFSFLQLPGR